MGFLAQLAKANTISQARNESQANWRAVFGEDKEEPQRKPQVTPGGSWGRSAINSPVATKRLLESLRSMAPGGWSDNRFEQTAEFTGIAYVAIHRLCTQLRQAEFQVFKRDEQHPDGKRPVTKYDPPDNGRFVRPYDLVELLQRPNKQDSFGKIMYRWGQQKFLTGTALTWMVPNRLGTPMELYCIPTATAIPQPTINPDYPDGYYRIQPIYPYGPFSNYPTPNSAVGAAIPAQWMLRFQYPHPLLRYEGFSPMTGLRLHLDEVNMIDRSRWYKAKKIIRPNAILDFSEMEGSQPLPDAEIDRIKAEYESAHMGPDNVGNLIVGTPGAKLDLAQGGDEDLDFQNGWEQLVSFAMGGFGITKEAAGMLNGASYAGLFASLKQLHLTTLDPECDDLGSDLSRDLAPFFGDDLVIEVRCKRIDDHDLIFTKIDKGILAKCLTKNMVLKMLDLPMTREPWGEEMAGMDPMQMMQEQGGMPGQGPPMPQQGPPGQGMGQGPPGGEWGPMQGAQAEPTQMDQSRMEPGPMANGGMDIRSPRNGRSVGLVNGRQGGWRRQ